jgi:hypothetical protein
MVLGSGFDHSDPKIATGADPSRFPLGFINPVALGLVVALKRLVCVRSQSQLHSIHSTCYSRGAARRATKVNLECQQASSLAS